ncbi:MAG: class I SAM-dependent methyltransferase [Phycisphaerales bacterium]|nr:class I SAM-dependent methyltransferase [Phycisphaerales bacterium]
MADPFTIIDITGASTVAPLRASAIGGLQKDAGVWRFDLPAGQHAYLTTRDNTRFAEPIERNAFGLSAGQLVRVAIDARLDGGAARASFIEYDETGQIAHTDCQLGAGPSDLVFRTHERHRAACVAIRLSGRGALRISRVSVAAIPELPGVTADSHVDDACLWAPVACSPDADAALQVARSSNGITLIVPADNPPIDGVGVLAMRRGADANAFLAARWAPVDIGTPAGLEFTINQLESLWRQGWLHALAIDLDRDAPLPREALEWLAQRRTPLLVRSDGAANQHAVVRAAREYDKVPVLVSSPKRDAPGGLSPLAGPPLRDALAIAADERRLILSRVESLRYPLLPRTPVDLDQQGFVITRAMDMPASEDDFAKEFWSEYEVKAWYKNPKPWALLVADVARALGAESVLEFGCNVGRNLTAVRDALPDTRIVGYDINPEAIRLGREASGLDLRLGNESTLAQHADSEFDLVFTVSVLDHVAEPGRVCRELIRVARKAVYMLEVRLPVEGKVLRHFDHFRDEVRDSTGASYSWNLETWLADTPRLRSLDRRPCYLHSGSLGPYYWAYLARFA